MSIPKLPFKPVQAGYSISFGDGTQRISLEGGSSRYRQSVSDNTHSVQAVWVLADEDYSAFMGFVRNMRRAGGGQFEVDLILDECRMLPYRAHFVPGSVRLVSKVGRAHTVNAELEVEADAGHEDPSLDYWGSLILMLSLYGDVPAVREVLNLFAELANEDLPNAQQR